MNEQEIEMLADWINCNILNKVRDYYGRNDRVSNDFIHELEEDTKERIIKYLKEKNLYH